MIRRHSGKATKNSKKKTKSSKRNLHDYKVPHRFLQGQIRPLKQAAFPLQRFSTNETDRKERKSLLAVNPGTQVMQGKNQLQIHLRYPSYWTNARNATPLWENLSMVRNRSEL